VTMPENLARVVDDFAAAPRQLRIDLLVEHAAMVPPLPAHLADHPERMEQVVECQTPFFLATKVDEAGRVQLFFDAPAEAPTTRGFAGILVAGLDGAEVDEVLAVPDDFHHRMGLAEAISPLRLRGMDAILFRLKAQLAARRAG
jgi:cysteine desulfuration protein SufE